MTTKDLRNNIEKVLGNSIRCLLPSYWWKRLFHQVADTIDEVNGVDIVSSESALNRLDAPIGSIASIANKKTMKPSECYVPTGEDSNLTDEELVAKLTRLTGLEVSSPLPDITGVEATAILVGEDAGGEDAWLGFLVISEGFCAAMFAKSVTNEKLFYLTSQSSVNSLNAFLRQHKFYYVGLDFEPEDTEEYIKETTEIYDRIFTIVDCTSDVYVKGLAWERLAKEGESGSASVPSYTLYYTTYQKNGVTTMADKYINRNKEEYAKITASQKAKENYLLQVVELGSPTEEYAPVDVELSWFSIADLNDTDANFNVTVCSFLQMDGAKQPQRRLVSFKSDGTAEYELIPAGDVKFLYYADGTNSLSAKEKAHNASAILPIKNSFSSSFTPSPIIIRYKIDSTKYLSLQGILSGIDAEGDGVSLTAFASHNQYFRFNYDLATGEPAKAEIIQTEGGEGSYDDTEIKNDIADLQAKDTQHDAKLTELSEEIINVGGREISYDSSILSTGYYIDSTNGNVESNYFRSCSDWIKVVEGGSLEFNCYGTMNNQGYAFYDKNKNYISGKNVKGVVVIDTIVPPNAAYIRITYVNRENTEYDFNTFYFKQNVKGKIADSLEEIASYSESDEFIRVYTDKDGRILWGIKIDGSVEFAKGCPKPIKQYVTEKIDSIELLSTISTTPSENVEDNIELTLDSENKKVSWRSADGVKHENKIKVEKNLSLSKTAMSDFIQSLVDGGFTTKSPIDFSDNTSIKLPIPRYCAVVNIISSTGLATSKTQDKSCILEYLDKSGNYFKKYIILNAQGSSSMAYIEKNQSIDIFNNEERTENCDIIFGNWVAQDSFHLKCYYIDVLRGVSNIAYKWAEEVIKETDSRNNRIIERKDEITAYQSTGDFATDFSDCALCHPDGFPFEMYVNGEYYGLYVWNLKKHRKNYSMNKKDYTSVILDGQINPDTFFNGVIDWTAFELRNPKDLVTMSGAEYDGENPQELIDSTSSKYNPSDSTHVKTAQTKSLVKRIASVMPQIIATSDINEAKNLFESHFDKRAMMCYFIVSNVLYHYDGFSKNWIWTIYNNVAAPSFYDMDSIFGRNWKGLGVESNIGSLLGISNNSITGQLVRLYKDEIDAMYNDLRDKEIISVENIMKYVISWVESATYEAIKRNIEKWPSIPSYRAEKNMDDGTEDGGMYDSPYRIKAWLSARLVEMDKYFNR